MPTDVRAVLVTAPDPEAAEAIARALVEEGLIACASLIPGVMSIYRWEGELKREREVLLVMKTTAARIPLLRDRTAELHPYEVPEVLVLSVDDGFGPYLEWVRAEVEGRL